MKCKYSCYEIEHNLAIWIKNDNVVYTPCSMNQNTIYGQTVGKIDSTQIWKNKKHEEVRDLIQKDFSIPGCRACYNDEKNGLRSRRIAVKSYYEKFINIEDHTDEKFVSIDFSVGNLCNLKCLICGPENSTSWIPEYKKLFPRIDIKSFQHNKNKQIDIDLSQIHGKIKRIHFHGGGEPLLTDNHKNFLKLIKKQQGLSDLYIFYNTNGSIKVDKETLDLWSECKLVELFFSIDDIGNRFEYQRPGLDWSVLEENLNWYKENMPVNHMFKINCVYSYLNFYYLDELYNWYAKNFKENRLGDPTDFILQKIIPNTSFNFELKSLTDYQFNVLKDKFQDHQNLTNLLSTIKIDNTEAHTEFWKTIDMFDNIKVKKYRESHSEWAILLNRLT
jgi:organic radical activating enzyme